MKALRETHHRILQRARAYDIDRKYRRRVVLARCLSALNVDRQCDAVQRQHFAKRLIVLPPQSVAFGQLNFLQRESITLNDAPGRLAVLSEEGTDLLYVYKTCDGFGLVKQV